MPDILTYGDAHTYTIQDNHKAFRTCSEVANLVKDTIIWKEALMVYRCHLAPVQNGGGVEEVLPEIKGSHYGYDIAHLSGQFVEGPRACSDEIPFQKQVLGRITA